MLLFHQQKSEAFRASMTVVLLLAWASTAALGAPLTATAQQELAGNPSATSEVERCARRAAASARSADEPRDVSGRTRVAGCVTDTTGIAHLLVEWHGDDGRTGRICTDPPITHGTWSCPWDVRALPRTQYTVELVAVDGAGNRGASEQRFRVTDPDPDPIEAPPAIPAPPPAVEEPPPPPPPSPPPPAADAASPVDPPSDLPPLALPQTPLEQLVGALIVECSRLELAPGVAPDRALSLAVLDCMTPALEAVGADGLALDEIPVPPAIEIEFLDPAAAADADALLPDVLAGVDLRVVVVVDRLGETQDQEEAVAGELIQ